MHYPRIISALLLITLATPSFAAETLNQTCDHLLTAAKSELGWFSKKKLFLLRKSIKKRVLEKCAALPQCTEQDLVGFVEEEILKLEHRSKKLGGYTFLAGAMATTAGITTGVAQALPENWQFATHLLGQVSAITLYVLGAPILEPVSSVVRRHLFSISSKARAKHDHSAGDLDRLWIDMQTKYSQNAQMVRNLIVQYKTTLQAGLTGIENMIEAGNFDQVAEILAVEAIYRRQFLAELPPDFEWGPKIVQSRVPKDLIEDRFFKTWVLKRIFELDESSRDPKVREYYQILIRTWFARPE